MPTVTSNTIRFDSKDWLAGLHPQESTGINHQLFNGFTSQRSIDPYKNLGYLQPGNNLEDVTNVSVVDSLIIAGVEDLDHNNKTYLLSASKLHELETFNTVLTNTGSYPHTITGANFGQDLEFYHEGTANHIYYSYNKASGGDIGRLTAPTTFDDDYWTAVLGGQALNEKFPHPMIIGDDGFLYIADGDKMHALDGSSSPGTAIDEVFSLPDSGFVIKGFAKLQPRTLVIFAEKNVDSNFKGQVFAYFWDYLNSAPFQIINLGDDSVNAPFEYRGTIGCFTRSFSPYITESKLKIWDGLNFNKQLNFEGNLPHNNGVEVIDKAIYWLSGRRLYSFGSPFSSIPLSFNSINRTKGTSNGLLRTSASLLGARYMSSGITTSGGLQVEKGGNNIAQFNTVIAKPILKPGKIARPIRVTIKYYRIIGGSNTREFSLILLSNGGSIGDVIDNSVGLGVKKVDETTVEFFEEAFNGDPFGKFDTISINGIWQSGNGDGEAPAIDYIEIEYELTNINK